MDGAATTTVLVLVILLLEYSTHHILTNIIAKIQHWLIDAMVKISWNQHDCVMRRSIQYTAYSTLFFYLTLGPIQTHQGK
jgi:hypothetical protein